MSNVDHASGLDEHRANLALCDGAVLDVEGDDPAIGCSEAVYFRTPGCWPEQPIARTYLRC